MSSSRLPRRLALAAAATAALLTAALTACGSSGMDHDMSGMNHGTTSAPASASATPGSEHSMPGMPGMDHSSTPGMEGSSGLSDNQAGYRLTTRDTTVPAGKQADYAFTITGPDGKQVTDFAVEQTKQMHSYAIRSDLTGFQHLHPTMATDGTWTAPLAALTPGTWRLYTSFTPNSGDGKGNSLVLSRTVTVDGAASTEQLPAASATAEVDGYTVTVKGSPMANMAHEMTVSIAKDGKPVTDLQPYLDTYAHLTAFHAGDLAFAHLHPETTVNGDHGGPDLTFHAEFPQSGDWRLFLQFQTAGQLHTAALTLKVS
ncbi:MULTISPECIES: hypothetical protein [Kitasatospora]|uniref:YtkA-like domain-containing protein n=1 Tax=Kitasatospora cathayae TaxID=3004092 RepID=A0ABY7Q1H7_9ACTN|nr:hypothetical protein [Kitasatospora sp. HUAS 3-15]WBP86302.1 hypothetical protein O1G21_10915 [Kitasatospora sp. HUAS 3-15]